MTAEWERHHDGWRVTLGPGQTIDNLDALIRGVIRETELRQTHRMTDADRDLLESELWAQAVRLVQRFQPRPGILLRPWLYQRLTLKAIDHLRTWHGRKGEKRVYDSRFVDHGLAEQAPELVGSDGHRSHRADPLGAAVAQGPGDHPDDWADAVERLYDRPDRCTLRAERALGVSQARGVAPRDHRAGAPGARPARPAAPEVAGRAAWIDCPACDWRMYRDSSGGPAFPTVCTGCGSALTAPAEIVAAPPLETDGPAFRDGGRPVTGASGDDVPAAVPSPSTAAGTTTEAAA